MLSGAPSSQSLGLAPIKRAQVVILGLLILLTAIAWIVVIEQSTSMMGMGLTMGMSAPFFIGIWIVMMAAMMFPSAAPMIVMFSRVTAGKKAAGGSFVPTWVFVASYLAVWAAAGVVAYLIASWLDSLAMSDMWLSEHGARLAGALFVAAGVYQLSPLKSACLARCRTPLTFLLTSWRDGYGGAIRMGSGHGLFCLGCCWLLFAILFPLGIMNIAAMAVVTALDFLEKIAPRGLWIARGLGGALIGYGALVLLVPEALPGAISG